MPVVLITGCSSGIGKALAIEYDKRGCTVYATARKLAALEALPKSINKLSLDVNSDQSCRDAVDAIVKEEGRIDVVVNNAGAGGNGPVAEWPVDDVKATFETNVFGAIRLNNMIIPGMIERKSGTIVVIGSIVGDAPTPWSGVYSMSKAAINAYADVLAIELRPFKVNVTLVTPAAVVSGFGKVQTEAALSKLSEQSVYWPARKYIEDRAMESQRRGPMATDVFASKVAAATLKKSPPAHMLLGGLPGLIFLTLLQYFPRWIWRGFMYRFFNVFRLAKQ